MMPHFAPSDYAPRRHIDEGSPRSPSARAYDHTRGFLPAEGRRTDDGFPHVYPQDFSDTRVLPSRGRGDPSTIYRFQYDIPSDAVTLPSARALGDMEMAHDRPSPIPNKVNAIEEAAFALQERASALLDQISDERLRSPLKASGREWQGYQRPNIGLGSTHDEVLSQHADLPPPLKSSANLGCSNPDTRGGPLGSSQMPERRFSDDSSPSVLPPSAVANKPPEGQRSHLLDGAEGQQPSENGVSRTRDQPDGIFSQNSSALARSVSPFRGRGDGELDDNLEDRLRVQGANAQPLKDEIRQLKGFLSDASAREMQLQYENHRLEGRLMELRRAYDKCHQELLDTTSRALEDRARFMSEIRAADQDIHVFGSSLWSLLVEFNLEPATRDPHAIVGGIKALVHRLRAEHGRKDLLPYVQPWQSPRAVPSSRYVSSPSPRHPMNTVPHSPERYEGLKIVPHASFPHAERPLSPTSPLSHSSRDWEQTAGVGNQTHLPTADHQAIMTARSPLHARQAQQVHFAGDFGVYPGYESSSYGIPNEEPNANVNTHTAEYSGKTEQLLPTLLEEPSSSLSDEEDPLPGISGLTITGDAVLGTNISATGYSINGTTVCHFQWVRHHRDGSFSQIPGASQPDYIITADDIDTILSLECTPMDDRGRNGETVEVYLDDQNWITLDPEMREQIEEFLESEQANFEVKLQVELQQDVSFEPVLLTLKRSMYELRRMNGKRLILSDRFSAESMVEVKVGKASQCAIVSNVSSVHNLDCDTSRLRDVLVLTMREFIRLAVDRRRTKKGFWTGKK